jgi:DNA-binding response OmpR family regulator
LVDQKQAAHRSNELLIRTVGGNEVLTKAGFLPIQGQMDKVPAATVLVVEDHDSVRIAIARFLTAGGFGVLEAESAEAAKAIWADHGKSISLLLVDIGLSTGSGPDLVQELLRGGPGIPVIFVTAADDIQSRAATREFPNPMILHKPFAPEALVKAVRNALAEPEALSGFTTFFKRPAKAT